MPNLTIEKPPADEYAPYFAKYVALVPDGDVIGALRSQMESTLATLRAVPEAASLHRYEPGKWSMREVAGHVTDTERIFAYRLLRFARGDKAPLAGFDQDPYIAAAKFDSRSWESLIEEFELVRRSSLCLLEGLDQEAWARRGIANGAEVSVRALAYLMAGHELHHMAIVRERYL